MTHRFFILGGSKISTAHVDAIILNNQKLAGIASRQKNVRNGDMRSLKSNMGHIGRVIPSDNLITDLEHYTDALDASTNDDIAICTLPTWLHHAAGAAGGTGGTHMLMEKPFCSTVQCCADVIAAYARHDGVLAVNHILPLFSEYDYLMETIRGWGTENVYLRMVRHTARSETEDEAWVRSVGGNAPDLFVHDGHLSILLFGMPVSMTVKQAEWMYDMLVYADVELQFRNGTKVSIDCGSPQHSTAFTAAYWAKKKGKFLNMEGGEIRNDAGEVQIEKRSETEVFALAHQIVMDNVDGTADDLGPLGPHQAMQAVQLIENLLVAAKSPKQPHKIK